VVKKHRKHVNSLVDTLNTLLAKAAGNSLSLEEILSILGDRGQAALLVLLSLPFCQPLQIPGFSTPFGLALGMLGLRIAFGKNPWLPRTLLEKHIPYHVLHKVVTLTIKMSQRLDCIIYTRMTWLTSSSSLHIAHGMTIALLAFLLALPLPIPLSNVLAAYPILAFGLGLMESDGLLIIIAYLLSLLCFSVFFSLIWFGKNGLQWAFT
jgi:hypothetical protein